MNSTQKVLFCKGSLCENDLLYEEGATSIPSTVEHLRLGDHALQGLVSMTCNPRVWALLIKYCISKLSVNLSY